MEPRTKTYKKRDAILTCLRATDTHPSAEDVHRMLQAEHPDISMATVYRNLSLFKAQGLAISVATVNGVERFDGNAAPHVHFICSTCDAVIDLDEMDVPDTLREAAARCCGGRVDSCQLSFTGLCRKCLEKENESGVTA